jgi:diacylglycerol O-acyltransferase / wax synthase
MEYLSGADDFWLRMEKPENPLTITGVLHFKGQLTLQALKAKLGDDLLRFQRFRQLVAGHKQLFVQPHWEDDPHFSLGRHVFWRELPAGDDDGLQRLIGELMSTPLDDSKPLWEMYVVEGPRPGTTLVARVHHSLADGFSLIRLMLGLVDEGCEVKLPGGATIPSLGPGGHRLETSVGRLEAARHFAEKLVDSGLRTLRQVPETGPLREVAACAAHLFTMEPDPPSGLKGLLSARKGVAWSDRIPLEGIKERARAYGGTINDLLLGVLAGALRRYLLDNGEQVEGKDLRASVPVNVRPFDLRTEELGNGFGLVFLDLPVGLASAEGRLEVLKARMDALKHSPEPFVTYGLMQAVGLLPAVIQQQLIGLFENKSTAVVTNMPGPTNRISMAGHLVDDAVFFVPQSAGAGVGISIFSYAGAVRIGVATDLALVPEPAALVAAYHAELAEIGVPLEG